MHWQELEDLLQYSMLQESGGAALCASCLTYMASTAETCSDEQLIPYAAKAGNKPSPTANICQKLRQNYLEHLVFVLAVDGQLLEEHHGKYQQLHVAALEHAAEVPDQVVPAQHALHVHVLREVEQQVEAQVQQTVLFLDMID